MIERHVTFHLHSAKAGDLESFFRSEYGPAMARQAGFVGAKLLQPAEGEDTLMLVLRFEDAAAAQAWRESADHKALSPRLKALYQSSEVRVFELRAEQPSAR